MSDNANPVPFVGDNIQNGIPEPQQDPTIPPNTHYLPNGDLTIESVYDYGTKTRHIKKVPLVEMLGLLETATDARETNLVNSDTLIFNPGVYKPHHTIFLPNIAQYIGKVITGADLQQKYLEDMMLCCQAYLDGTMEISETGFFRVLNTRRDGLNRRYSKLCMCVYYSISEEIYKSLPAKVISDIEIQSLIQDLIMPGSTSMYVKLKPYNINGIPYNIPKPSVSAWLNTTPWHSIIYNSQTPITFVNFLRLFFKLYCLYGGKITRYIEFMPNQIVTDGILPNSDYFVKLNPENTNSFEQRISNTVPLRIARLIRYLVKSESTDDPLTWIPYGTEDDDSDNDDNNDNNENTDTNTPIDGEGNDSVLA